MNTYLAEVPGESLFSKNVRTFAHYLYVLRGCRDGQDVNDWMAAEAQLKDYRSLVQGATGAKS